MQKYPFINIKSADLGKKGSPSAITFDPITAKIENAVPGKIDKNSIVARRAKMLETIYHSENVPLPLNIAFDFAKSKEIPIPKLKSETQEGILGVFLYHFSTSNFFDMEHSSKSYIGMENNYIFSYAEEVRKTNPHLIKNIVIESIEEKAEYCNKIERNKMIHEIEDSFEKGTSLLKLYGEVNDKIRKIYEDKSKIINNQELEQNLEEMQNNLKQLQALPTTQVDSIQVINRNTNNTKQQKGHYEKNRNSSRRI